MGQLTTEQARELQAKRLREPLDYHPFLCWCVLREREIGREIDRSTLQISNPNSRNRQVKPTRPRRASSILLDEIGWDREAGERRLFRWCNEPTVSGVVERAVIEDALHHARVDFYDVYPDLEPDVGVLRDGYCLACARETTTTDGNCPWCEGPLEPGRPKGSQPRVGQGRHMTDQQVRAAHVVYERSGLSIMRIATLIYRRYGYTSPSACASSLNKAFVHLGLARRDQMQASIAAHLKHGMLIGGKTAPLYKRALNLERHGPCQATMKYGKPCPRAAQPGSTTCGYHAPNELERRRRQVAALNAERKNTLRWAGHEKAAA